MKNGWIKLLVLLITAAALAGAITYAVQVKDTALEDMVTSVQTTLSRVEAQQVVNQIEYGLKYGKQLEYYFNADSLLQRVHMASSYLQGVYLTDAAHKTLYSTTGTKLPLELWQRMEPAEYGAYQQYTLNGITYISMQIEGADGTTAGSMVMKMDTNAMRYLIEARQEEGALQSWLIGLYAFAFCIIVLARLKVRKPSGQFRPLRCALVICLTVLLCLGADLGIEAFKVDQEVEKNVTRSAQRIAQTLQQEIDTVVEKGVNYDDIASLSPFFRENAASIPSVDSFQLDLNNKVVAIPSEAYMADSVSKVAAQYAAAWGRVALCCLPIFLAGALWQYMFYRRRNASAQVLQERTMEAF